MKTQSIELYPQVRRDGAAVGNALPRFRSATCLTVRTLIALVPALALVVSSAWLVTVTGLAPFLQAAIWAAGFAFLGLAVESERSDTALLMLMTGVALPVLAFLSSRVATELAIVAATLVAAWTMVALLRHQALRG